MRGRDFVPRGARHEIVASSWCVSLVKLGRTEQAEPLMLELHELSSKSQ